MRGNTLDEGRKREPYRDIFSYFIKDMIDLFKRMDEDLSRFIDGEINFGELEDESFSYASEEDSPNDFVVGFPSSSENVRKVGGAPLELEEQGVDVIELEDEIIIVADLPGVRRNDISVKVRGNELTIRAKDFLKKLQLPMEIDPKRTKATYRNGILEVRISKR
ncbi:MAG: hypothetical protein DRN78_04080 [Thermoproteota archaeon]|nr:MAG: hypothetical protein DRN78_04080 [Candidatus Korarchaeota archaeon]